MLLRIPGLVFLNLLSHLSWKSQMPRSVTPPSGWRGQKAARVMGFSRRACSSRKAQVFEGWGRGVCGDRQSGPQAPSSES